MKYVFDNDCHIHSRLSLCSNDPGQTPERILEYARRYDLKTICLTDHFWDEKVPGAIDWYSKQNFAHISEAKPLPQADGIRFLFGCETEMDRNMTLGISKERFDEFDFVVIPTTHFHMSGFTIPEDYITPEQRAEFWHKKLNALLNMDLPFHKIGIAHLACPLMNSPREKYIETMAALSESDMENAFGRAAEKGVGIELNYGDMKFSDSEADTVLRPFKIAKHMGCKFYCGSDAHHPAELDDAKNIFERAIDMLGLTENDKFNI